MHRRSRNHIAGVSALELLAVAAILIILLVLAWPKLREARGRMLSAELEDAVNRDDRAAALQLLKRGAPPDAWSGSTPHFCLRCKAILERDLEMARLIFPPGSLAGEAGNRHVPPLLSLAVMQDDRSIAEVLLRAGVSTTTPVYYFSRRYRDGAYQPETAIGRGYNDLDAKPLMREERGVRLSPLGVAIEDQNEPVVVLLLENTPAPVLQAPDDAENEAYTLLQSAVNTDNPHIVRLLLYRGVPVDGLDAHGATALHAAAAAGRDALVLLLIERGAGVNIADGEGYTPLHRAAMACRRSTITLLLAHGADPEARNAKGWRPRETCPTGCYPDTP
jgi:ankyrin repeat protein